ncbi:MAG: hypothetical protein Q8O11_04790, partial [Syntrophales bacterium]|nr:hypothetical protein [Syntrophales bacterium]
VFEEGLLDFDNIREYKPGIATAEDINRAHICVPDAKDVVTESHLISAGGAITAAQKVLSGEVDNAFALVRPPGHHAMLVVHGARGFCNINNEAIMIEYIRRHYGPKRIAVVDTDCHHGDGTQDIYWNDPDTLCISIHQDGRTLYPGTGVCDDCGGLVMIESVADTGNSVFAVILPGRCCPECRNNGEMFFERTNRGKHVRAYFQDRERGICLVK